MGRLVFGGGRKEEGGNVIKLRDERIGKVMVGMKIWGDKRGDADGGGDRIKVTDDCFWSSDVENAAKCLDIFSSLIKTTLEARWAINK